MRRLYYLTDSFAEAERVSDALHEEGVRDWNFHILAKDEAGLYQHRLHAATTLQQLDVIRTGERWALIGGTAFLLLGLLSMATQPLPWETNALTVALLTLLGGMFGAWVGGMFGLRRESYKLSRFHDDIEAGRLLIMVDVGGDRRAQVREIMNMRFPEVTFAGSDSTLINPFARPHRLYHQTTH